MSPVLDPSAIRARFARAMSAMYREEVPQYGALIDLVREVNAATLDADPALRAELERTGSLARLDEERHGAIRLGTPAELATMRRLFAVMGMHPVSYYDLSVAGIPVHSTAFRATRAEDLRRSPFRVFTSLLRLDLIADSGLRAEAAEVLSRREIFTPGAMALIGHHEARGGLDEADAERFVAEALETFRWHRQATVSAGLYRRLHDAHRLIADIVSFRGPHINHLTPRTLDIDRVQEEMPRRGIAPKAVVEGPPPRRCPILLRQTSFKALEEPIDFPRADGDAEPGRHTARFGEIEARGAALTPNGRALYDRLLGEVRARIAPAPDGSNAEAYRRTLAEVFAEFPDDAAALRKQALAYRHYAVTGKGRAAAAHGVPEALLGDPEALVDEGLLGADPIVYEDFLPVSAAGIFLSNLDGGGDGGLAASPNQAAFEEALGAPVTSEFALYEAAERQSLETALRELRGAE